MIDKILEIKELLAVILSMIISFIVVLLKLFKNVKLKNKAQSLIEVEKSVKDNICRIEDFTNFTGIDKKEWVKTKVNQFCINKGMEYDEKIVDELIEMFISFSKLVNKTDKEENELL